MENQVQGSFSFLFLVKGSLEARLETTQVLFRTAVFNHEYLQFSHCTLKGERSC